MAAPAGCLINAKHKEQANIVILSVSCVLGLDEDWSNHWGTSPAIKRYTGADAPYEQWGVVATALGGAGYLMRRCVRAHHLMQAARASSLAEKQWHAAVAWVAPHEVEAAPYYAIRFMTRGAVIGLGAPLLWLAYLHSKHPKHR